MVNSTNLLALYVFSSDFEKYANSKNRDENFRSFASEAYRGIESLIQSLSNGQECTDRDINAIILFLSKYFPKTPLSSFERVLQDFIPDFEVESLNP